MAIEGGAIKRRWPATYSGRELVLPEASAIAMLYVAVAFDSHAFLTWPLLRCRSRSARMNGSIW